MMPLLLLSCDPTALPAMIHYWTSEWRKEPLVGFVGHLCKQLKLHTNMPRPLANMDLFLAKILQLSILSQGFEADYSMQTWQLTD